MSYIVPSTIPARRPLPPVPVPIMIPKPISTKPSDFSAILRGDWKVPISTTRRQIDTQAVEQEYMRDFQKYVVGNAHHNYVRSNTPPPSFSMPNPHPCVSVSHQGPEPPSQFFFPRVQFSEDVDVPDPEDVRQEVQFLESSRPYHMRAHTYSNAATIPPPDQTSVFVHRPVEWSLPRVPLKKYVRHEAFNNVEQTAQVHWKKGGLLPGP